MTYRQPTRCRADHPSSGPAVQAAASVRADQLRWLLVLALAAATVLLLLAPKLSWAADQKVKIWVNGCPKDFGGIARNGVQYVPLGATVKAVGAKMTWNAAAKQASIISGSRQAVVKRSQGVTVGGALYIPLKSVGPALDCRATWDGAAKAVRIETRKTAPVPT
jgi:hypothetical protein